MAEQLTPPPDRPRIVTRVMSRYRYWPLCAWCSGTGVYLNTEALCPCGELEPDTTGGREP